MPAMRSAGNADAAASHSAAIRQAPWDSEASCSCRGAPLSTSWRIVTHRDASWHIDVIMVWPWVELQCGRKWLVIKTSVGHQNHSWIKEAFVNAMHNIYDMFKDVQRHVEGQCIEFHGLLLAGATGGSSFGTRPTTVWFQGSPRSNSWNMRSGQQIKLELTATWAFWEVMGSPDRTWLNHVKSC